MSEDGSIESESKKQASRLKREMRRITSNLSGIRNMSRLPGVVVVVDARKEALALREARKLGLATVALLDTDSDPDTVDVAIPANDDSIRAVDLLLNELADAVSIGKTMVAVRQDAPQQRVVRKPRVRRSPSGRSHASAQADAGGGVPPAATKAEKPQAVAIAEPAPAAKSDSAAKPEQPAAKPAPAASESQAQPAEPDQTTA